MNAPSVVSNRTSSLFTPFYIVIPTSLQGKAESPFKRLSSSFYRGAGCLCFRNGAFNRGLALIYFGNEGVTTRQVKEGAAMRFYWYVLQEPFCIFSPRSSRHRLSPYLRVEFLFLQFFILCPPCSSPFSFLPLVRTYDSCCSFEHRANYFLSGSVEL